MAKKKSFHELLRNEQMPVLVDFYADWCGPCKTMSPVLQEVAGQLSGRVKIIKVNVDKNQAAAARYQVKGIPTFILFSRGKSHLAALRRYESRAAQIST